MSLSNKELLDRIKRDVAKENGFKKWTDIVQNVPDDHEFKYWPIVCERYATEKAKSSCEATLKKASENVKLKPDSAGGYKYSTEIDRDKGAMSYSEGDYKRFEELASKQRDIEPEIAEVLAKHGHELFESSEPQEKSTKHCGGINCPFEYSCIDGCMYPKPIISIPC